MFSSNNSLRRAPVSPEMLMLCFTLIASRGRDGAGGLFCWRGQVHAAHPAGWSRRPAQVRELLGQEQKQKTELFISEPDVSRVHRSTHFLPLSSGLHWRWRILQIWCHSLFETLAQNGFGVFFKVFILLMRKRERGGIVVPCIYAFSG